MKKSPSSEANSHSTSLEISLLSWNPQSSLPCSQELSLSWNWTRWIQSTTSQTISVRSILKVSSNLRLSLPYGLFPSGFLKKILCIILIASVLH